MGTPRQIADVESDYVAICARMPENALVAAECRNLTGGTPAADGVAVCRSVEHVSRAAYVRSGVRILARGDTLDDVVSNVASADFDAEGFRIDFHAPTTQTAFAHRQAVIELADVIPYYPDLDDPDHQFLVLARDDGLWFGEVVTESRRMYRRHDAKPRTTSFSLSSRLARALVNLVAPTAETILDPCCGTGSVLLEAASLGIRTYGADWNDELVDMARENLAHFDYDDAVVEHADARTYERTADAVVTDLPYGLTLNADDAVIKEILGRAATLAPVAVYVAGEDITDWLEAAGYRDVDVYSVFKRAGSARYVHVGRSRRYGSAELTRHAKN